MSKIVLDTNCLVQCIPSRSKYRIIWNRFPKNIWQFRKEIATLQHYC